MLNPFKILQMSIPSQLKTLRENAGLSQKKIALELGITQGAYSLIENGQNSITTDHLMNLSKLYSVSTDHILKGSNSTVIKSTKNGFIPLINIDAHAGFIKNKENNEWLETLEMFKIPGFDAQKGQKLFEVDGDSMMPTLIPGDILIAHALNDLDDFIDGSIMVVVTATSVLVKRIKRNHFKKEINLISDNKNYDPIIFPLQRIDQLFAVKGKITSSLNIIDIDSGSKIKNLEIAVKEIHTDLSKFLRQLNITEKN